MVSTDAPVHISIVIPAYNEELSLPLLFPRLTAAMDAYGKPYEIIFINDGSRDQTQMGLVRLFNQRPDVVRVVEFMRNYGQHSAIIAGFGNARGELIVTLDCDLQNPPEDIPLLLAKIEEGHDVVGSYRRERQDVTWRKSASRLANVLRERITRIRMRDQGCMLRAYTKPIVSQILQYGGSTPYIPALGQYFAANPAEVEVGHEERAAGVSNYNFYRLLRLNFDIITYFSLLPLQLFTIIGMLLSACSLALVVYMLIRRIFVGPEVDGVFTLFAILFLLVSVTMTGLGLLGEYVGRIYKEVQQRPQYRVKSLLEKPQP